MSSLFNELLKMSLIEKMESIYYMVFLICTAILVYHTVIDVKNREKQPGRIVARVNYNFSIRTDRGIPVTIDIHNEGDYTISDILIVAKKKGYIIFEDVVTYIAPKESFSYYLGYIVDNNIEWFSGGRSKLKKIQNRRFFTISICDTNRIDVEIR